MTNAARTRQTLTATELEAIATQVAAEAIAAGMDPAEATRQAAAMAIRMAAEMAA